MTRLGERVRHPPLRVRLVAGFAAAMLVLLTAAGAFVYWRVEYALDRGLDGELKPHMTLKVEVTREDGTQDSFEVLCRIDTLNEVEYFKAGGILHYVLRSLI